MDRRAFLLGAGAAGLAACAAPERDLLEPYDDVDIPLEPGVVSDPAELAPEGEPGGVAMDALREQVPAEDQAGLSFVARALVPTVAVRRNLNDETPTWTFENPIESGGDLVFLVEDYDGAENYEVLLPTRPNGSVGWIHRDDVELLRHNFAIRVDLDEFALQVFDHDEVVFETSVGVARENAPTPLGQYYTTEVLRPLTPDTVYGAFAYGLSGYSDTFTSFNGGPGQLGIHGTNDPGSIGTNVSSGCIRLTNPDITTVVETLQVPVGVPVEIL